MIKVATIGWISSFATKRPLKHPISAPTTSAAINPRIRGLAYSVAARSPPVSTLQQTAALTAIIAPTEISVPAEADTTSVMPTARIASSDARLMISIRKPYRTPSLISMEKKSGLVKRFTNRTRARQKIGRNKRCDVIFFRLLFMLLSSCYG